MVKKPEFMQAPSKQNTEKPEGIPKGFFYHLSPLKLIPISIMGQILPSHPTLLLYYLIKVKMITARVSGDNQIP